MSTFRALAALATALAAACSASEPPPPAYVNLTGDAMYPEGIAAARDGSLYVTGFGDGSLHRIAPDGTEQVLRPAGADARGAAVGMALDEARDRLWVARFDFGTTSSALQVFTPSTGALVAELAPPADAPPHFFNEVALDAAGRVYVSDTLGPRIWTAGPDLAGVEVFVEHPSLVNQLGQPFGLNGLALAPGGGALVASVMDRLDQGDGRLVRVDVATREVRDVALTGDAVPVFGGGDGMLFTPAGDLLLVNVTPPAAILTARFSADLTRATLTQHHAFAGAFDRPTAPALTGDTLWVVNSQLDHIIDDANGALGTPPTLPFQIVGVSLPDLLD